MTARHIVSLGTLAGALFAASPAFAQDMTYGGDYEYAQSAPPAMPGVVYRQEAVAQPIPATVQPGAYNEADYGADYEIEETRAGYHGSMPAPPAPHHAMHPPMVHGQGGYPAPPPFDRAAWLEECEARYGEAHRKSGNGGIVGGLLGAVAGGLIGNRIADGDRLAGTLIGGGVGGIAGAAIGAAIGSSGKHRRNDDAMGYCEDWLARYSTNYYPQWYQQQQYILVPVTVMVPQRAVVREYITEEYVDVPVTTYETIPARRAIKRVPVTQPVKRVPVKRVKSVKGQ